MRILDPGHIYETQRADGITSIMKFIKRGGGAIQYLEEWPGIQTQAVMRALIDYLQVLQFDPDEERTYPLWQLGHPDPQNLTLKGIDHVFDVTDVLIDRSWYLNSVLECVETQDAISWMDGFREISYIKELTFEEKCESMIFGLRMALWNYEVRAYRRKQEEVNRKQPEHDDSARPRPWRDNPCDDVPFNEEEIELRPIGLDGHIVLSKENNDE